jgi:hypothetical protein
MVGNCGFPYISSKAMNILLAFATSYQCKTALSAVAANRTKYRSMTNLKMALERPSQNSNVGMIFKEATTLCPTNPGMKHPLS